MKTKTLIGFIATFLMSSTAMAFSFADQGTDFEAAAEAFEVQSLEWAAKPAAFCQGLTIDASQKAALRKSFMQTRREMAQAKADIEIAKIDYMEVLTDTASKSTDATIKANNLASAMTAIPSLFLDLHNTIVYDIFTVDQRIPGLRCLAKMQKKMMMKRLRKACKRLPRTRPRPPHGHPGRPTPNPPHRGGRDHHIPK